MRRARPDLRPVLAYVAHGLRDPADDTREAGRVAALAARLDADHVVLSVTVERSGEGVESDARRARHAALEAEATRRGASAVLHGHHAEDQAETLLLRLARGTGVDGLAGMAVVSGMRVRPLLDVRRADAHLAAAALVDGALDGVAHDPMNDDLRLARVRLRRDVLPGLAAVGPDPVGALARLATLARADAEVLDAAVATLRASLVIAFGPALLVPSAELRALPAALGRRLVRTLLPDGEARATASVERLRTAPDGWRATLPGPVDAAVDRGHHLVVPVAVPDAPPEPLAGTLHHAPSGMTIVRSGDDLDARLDARPTGALPPGLRADRLTVRLRGAGALTVRTRRAGDRVRTPGGSRPLGDVLADAGVPLALRDLLPVVAGPDGRVVWVPGVVVDASLHAGTPGDGE